MKTTTRRTARRACSICGQRRDVMATRTAAARATLFGTTRYVLCPGCGQQVPHPYDHTYRQNAREFLAGARPQERPGLGLYARRSSNGGFHWVYRERR